MKGIVPIGELYLDTDTDPKINKGSDYILNMGVNEGRKGIGVNVRGNRKIIDHLINNGDIIQYWGWCFDKSLGRAIFFATDKNSGIDIIYYIDISLSNPTVEVILKSTSALNFSKNIDSCVIGSYLVWADGVNPVREINYVRMLGSGYVTFNVSGVTLIATGSVYRIGPNYFTVTSVNINSGGNGTMTCTATATPTPGYLMKVSGIGDSSVTYSSFSFGGYPLALFNSGMLIDPEVIKLYKKPANSLIGVSRTISLTGFGYPYGILNKSYQFATRFLYTDNQKSVISQVTDINWTSQEAFPNGQYTIEDGTLNYVLTLPIPPNDVSQIEILVRTNEQTDWYSYDTVSYSSTTYTFDDTNVWIPVDQNELNRPYDFIPDNVKHLTSIEDNRVLLANYVEGFNPVNVDASMSVDIINLPDKFSPATLVSAQTWIDASDSTKIDVIPQDFPTGGVMAEFSFSISSTGSSGSIVPNYQFTDYVTLRYTDYSGNKSITDVYNYIISVLGSGFASISTLHGGCLKVPYSGILESPTSVDFWTKFSLTTKLPIGPAYYVVFYDYNLKFYTYNPVYKTLKDLDNYLGSIVYYNKDLKYSTVNRIPGNLSVAANTTVGLINQYKINVTINSQPPTSAFYYSLAFAKRTNKGYFVQFVAKNEIDYYFGNDGFLRIKLQGIINSAITLNKVTITSYDFQQGDKIRIIGCAKNQTPTLISGVYTAGGVGKFLYLADSNYPSISDVPVLGTEYADQDSSYQRDYSGTPGTTLDQPYVLDANGNKMYDTNQQLVKVAYTQLNQIYDPGTTLPIGLNYITAYDYLIFEIYRPAEKLPEQFYYHDNIFPVINPGTINAFHGTYAGDGNQYQTSFQPAKITSNFGDTYVKVRDCKYVFCCQEDNYSDYYDSAFYGLGKPNVYDQYQAQLSYPNGLIFGGKLINQTKINEINTFLYSDEVLLKLEYGEITSLNEIANELKVLHQQEETSIYIGRTELMNSDESSNLSSSTSVLGTINYLSYGNGTVFPRSVVEYQRDLFYLDIYSGEVIRTGTNGRDAISKNGMTEFFKNVCDIILNNGYDNYDVEGGYDEFNKMYLLTINNPLVATFTINGSLVNGFTVGFYDPKDGKPGRWKTFYSFIPQMYSYVGKFLMSFDSLSGWIHNDTTVPRCNFYGVQYSWIIDWYFNLNPTQVKTFKNLLLRTNSKWNVNSIDIEPSLNYPSGMQSKLDPTKFAQMEGGFTAAYLKNMLTHGSLSNLDLINGDTLRGLYAKHQMTNNSANEAWIEDAEIIYDNSLI